MENAKQFILAPTAGFDEQNVVLNFAAVSDLHAVMNPGKTKNAMKRLRKASLEICERELDAVVVAGDMTLDYSPDKEKKKKEVDILRDVYNEVFDPYKVPFVYVMGNHDHDSVRNGGSGFTLTEFIEAMGDVEAHTKFDLPCPDTANGSRHSLINGYHFFFVEPIAYNCTADDDSGTKFREETKAWLETELTALTEKEPCKYFFVVTHPMIYGTVYGSELDIETTHWYTKDLTPILEKFPQAVTFGGHLHFPLHDERTIMQGKFTSIGCGSMHYMAIENGGYEDMAGATIPKDCGAVLSGFIVQVDKHGALRFIRLDLFNGAVIKDAFVISAPKQDGSHLLKYTKARADIGTAPSFPENTVISCDGEKLVFSSAISCDLVHHYVISINDGEQTTVKKILADFFRHPDPKDMKKEQTLTFSPDFFKEGREYFFTVTALDSWDRESEKVTYTYKA